MRSLNPNKRGILLLMVMGFLMLLMVLATFFFKMIAIFYEDQKSVENILQAQFHAQSGINIVLEEIKSFFAKHPITPISGRESFLKEIKREHLHVIVHDLSSRLNVNSLSSFSEFKQKFRVLNTQQRSPLALDFDSKSPLLPWKKGSLYSLHQLGAFFLSSKNKIHQKFKEDLSLWNSQPLATIPHITVSNLWEFTQKHKNTQKKQKIFVLNFQKLYPQKHYQIVSALIDFLDTDHDLFFFKKSQQILSQGQEPRPLINEVCYKTKPFSKKNNPYRFKNSEGGGNSLRFGIPTAKRSLSRTTN